MRTYCMLFLLPCAWFFQWQSKHVREADLIWSVDQICRDILRLHKDILYVTRQQCAKCQWYSYLQLSLVPAPPATKNATTVLVSSAEPLNATRGHTDAMDRLSTEKETTLQLHSRNGSFQTGSFQYWSGDVQIVGWVKRNMLTTAMTSPPQNMPCPTSMMFLFLKNENAMSKMDTWICP